MNYKEFMELLNKNSAFVNLWVHDWLYWKYKIKNKNRIITLVKKVKIFEGFDVGKK